MKTEASGCDQCVCVCVCACMRAYVRACVHACVGVCGASRCHSVVAGWALLGDVTSGLASVCLSLVN